MFGFAPHLLAEDFVVNLLSCATIANTVFVIPANADRFALHPWPTNSGTYLFGLIGAVGNSVGYQINPTTNPGNYDYPHWGPLITNQWGIYSTTGGTFLISEVIYSPRIEG